MSTVPAGLSPVAKLCDRSPFWRAGMDSDASDGRVSHMVVGVHLGWSGPLRVPRTCSAQVFSLGFLHEKREPQPLVSVIFLSECPIDGGRTYPHSLCCGHKQSRRLRFRHPSGRTWRRHALAEYDAHSRQSFVCGASNTIATVLCWSGAGHTSDCRCRPRGLGSIQISKPPAGQI